MRKPFLCHVINEVITCHTMNIKLSQSRKRTLTSVLKKADKGTTTVIMNKCGKIQEAQIQLDNREHYKPLQNPMTVETSQRVHELVAQLHQNNFIDDMTKKWFSQTLTKIQKPNPVGRPIISGCEGPTERLSSFVDKLLQPIAQKQKSYLKDTTDFLNFKEKTKVSQDTILVSMDVTSLLTNFILLLNLRPKFQKTRQAFSTQ